ncbi:MAG TPA: nucleoside phosphorylase [Flavobacteriales bacterium]|nr:nucleoside phosphorylase [Flavobacteriales bacterium]
MAESSELIVTPEGAIYHLNLRPEQIAGTIIVVGDQNRVFEVSKYFDRIDHKVSNREFITHTGVYRNKPLTVLSTGIGPDNIDIVLNELDALVNFDLITRKIKPEKKSLNIIRLGTSGSLQPDIPVDSAVVSQYAIGFDGVLPFYKTAYESDEDELCEAFKKHTDWSPALNPPYAVRANSTLFNLLAKGHYTGITATANGFYGPQGRVLRLEPANANLNALFSSFEWNGLKLTNYEMETSALYGLAGLLGHKACTVCAIIANRYKKQYSKNYHALMENRIGNLLDALTQQIQ